MTGTDGHPCLRLEAICDLDLYIWAFQIGFPGAMNDINVLHTSDHFSRVLNGQFPPSAPKTKINEEECSTGFIILRTVFTPAGKYLSRLRASSK